MLPMAKWPIPRRFGLKTAFVLLTVAGLLCAYARSYYILSRRGMAESRFANSIHGGDEATWSDNWSYITDDEIQADLDAGTSTNLDRNRRLYWFYRPASLIDVWV